MLPHAKKFLAFATLFATASATAMTPVTASAMPMAGSAIGNQVAVVAKGDKQSRLVLWFKSYDEIRHQAQMSDSERDRARQLMTQSVASALMQSSQAAQDKASAAALLQKMVDRYQRAQKEMAQLSFLPETKKLYAGYNQYFHDAAALFSDYMKVQNNFFATDANGNSLMAQLQQRKCDLESLDAANKALDSQLRDRYHIAPYPW